MGTGLCPCSACTLRRERDAAEIRRLEKLVDDKLEQWRVETDLVVALYRRNLLMGDTPIIAFLTAEEEAAELMRGVQ